MSGRTFVQQPGGAECQGRLGVAAEALEGAAPSEVGLVPRGTQSHSLVRICQSLLVTEISRDLLCDWPLAGACWTSHPP